MKKVLLFISLIIITCFPLTPQETYHKWIRMTGKWVITNSQAIETQAKAIKWDYYEIINYNSILSLKPLIEHSSIELKINVLDKTETPAELTISFAVNSESQSWFYHMYAFRLTGGFWGMDRVSLIFSDRADKSKPFNTKNNTFIKELASADCKVKYGRSYNYRVAFEGNDVALYINDEKVLSAPFPEKSNSGRIAIGSRNAKISIDKVTVSKDNQVIFEDDFNEDTIFVKVLKVQRVPANDGNIPEGKNPE